MTAKIYFTDLRTSHRAGLLDKMERLFDKAGLGTTVEPKDLMAIKRICVGSGRQQEGQGGVHQSGNGCQPTV